MFPCLGLYRGFFFHCLFISVFGWHCAFSQLVCPQRMPYDGGLNHLCARQASLLQHMFALHPQRNNFKAMSCQYEHRSDLCRQRFARAAISPNSS